METVDLTGIDDDTTVDNIREAFKNQGYQVLGVKIWRDEFGNKQGEATLDRRVENKFIVTGKPRCAESYIKLICPQAILQKLDETMQFSKFVIRRQ